MYHVFLITAFLYLFGSNTNLHPVHVTVTNIEVDTINNRIEYSIRIFADDFVYAIEHLYETNILFSDGISQQEKEIVTVYTDSMLEMYINGSKCKSQVQKIETMENSLWIYLNILNTEKKISSLKVINKLLLDFFPDQTNLTIVTIDGKQMGYTFDYKNQAALIDIK